jgi:lysophospholipase L1-like esterase
MNAEKTSRSAQRNACGLGSLEPLASGQCCPTSAPLNRVSRRGFLHYAVWTMGGVAVGEVWAAPAGKSLPEEPPYWAEAMKTIHASFKGNAGYIAQFGDSITYSMAFWTPIGWDEPDTYLTREDGLPKRPQGKRWRDTLKGFRSKGPEQGNYSGWRAGDILGVIDSVLKREQPEAALIMVGTNDISGGAVPDGYREGLKKIVQKCLDACCVPVLNTIPPRRGHQDGVEAANRVIREIALACKVPLADFHAACLRLRSGQTWDNTIISEDGVHPSGGKANVYTEENMKVCGYALRNWVNFLAIRELYFRVLDVR